MQRIPFNISRRSSLISLMIVLKTDHYIWGWKRNYYVIWSRDVKTEVTNDNFRFEMPRKHLTIYISECISEIDIFSGFNLTKIVWNAIFVISYLRLVTCLRWNFIPTKLSRNNYSLTYKCLPKRFVTIWNFGWTMMWTQIAHMNRWFSSIFTFDRYFKHELNI